MTTAILLSYLVTGILLLLLALIMYKASPSSGIIKTGIIFSYIISPFIGGILIGKKEKTRRFLWGILLGVLYFVIIFIVAAILNQNMFGTGSKAFTVMAMCILGGMLGGMIS